MSMSKDRVEFRLTHNDNNRKLPKNVFVGLIMSVFGLNHAEAVNATTMGGVIIRCRPSQFARFIIKRMELGEKHGNNFCNGIKELMPKLIEVEPEPEFLDVSKRPRGNDD